MVICCAGKGHVGCAGGPSGKRSSNLAELGPATMVQVKHGLLFQGLFRVRSMVRSGVESASSYEFATVTIQVYSESISPSGWTQRRLVPVDVVGDRCPGNCHGRRISAVTGP